MRCIHMMTNGTWKSQWAFRWKQLRAGTLQSSWGRGRGNIAQGSHAVVSSSEMNDEKAGGLAHTYSFKDV